ncbi:macro domain-containing protein [Pseudomonas sp. NFACC08-1]|uniref:macro domain-containing protein n=1 Tax=Pseudomonas sp. NFACC08-1 TaxID=1566238 RepID=UPI00089D9423|nr:macro domain-containing protein [Pseudomonas sp. NFACC08-1]SDX97918.1 Macro domain-containing protein [Pseudomonas sp. NFACC08-1]
MNRPTAARYILGLIFEAAISKLKRPHNVYSKLSVTALIIGGGALVTPFWQQALEGTAVTLELKPISGPIPSIVSGVIFLVLAILFAEISRRTGGSTAREPLVDTKAVSEPIVIGKSKIYCYCGSIVGLTEVEVLVTSENRYLKLGGVDGTSVSGRVRRLAASFRVDGSLSADPLGDFIDKWKKSQPHSGPYQLGTTIVSPPFNACAVGIKHIIHAVALEKRDDGVNLIDERSIRKIIQTAINECVNSSCKSVFIPIFGLGSGRILADEAISKTVLPIIEAIKSNNVALDIYLGTYRLTDAAQATSMILKRS